VTIHYIHTCINTRIRTYIQKLRTYIHTVTDLINALPGNSSVNTVQLATIEEATFSANPTDAPVD
jgi:hypothetical protein